MDEAISIIFVIIFRKLAGQTSPVRLVRSPARTATDQRKNPVNFSFTASRKFLRA